MYVNPFWFGVAVGAITEFILLVVFAVIYSKRRK